MSNELTTLPQFTRNLFRHAFWILPWFCHSHPKLRLRIQSGIDPGEYLEAIRQDACPFFGSHPELDDANQSLSSFYADVKPAGE